MPFPTAWATAVARRLILGYQRRWCRHWVGRIVDMQSSPSRTCSRSRTGQLSLCPHRRWATQPMPVRIVDRTCREDL